MATSCLLAPHPIDAPRWGVMALESLLGCSSTLWGGGLPVAAADGSTLALVVAAYTQK